MNRSNIASAIVAVMASAAFWCCGSAWADERTLDVRNGTGSSTTEQVEPGNYTYRVVGLVDASYRFEVRKEIRPIATLTKPGDTSGPFAPSAVLPGLSPACKELADAVNEARQAWDAGESEAKFYAAREKATAALEAATQCPSAEREILRRELNTLETLSTKADFEPYTLDEGEILVLTVIRVNDGKDGPKWVYELSTGARGSWRSSWGIGWLPDKDEEYFAKGINDTQFQVTKERDNGGWTPAAAAFYTWLSEADRNRAWVGGPTVGLGIDKSNLMVFGGWNWTFHENVGVNVGVAFHQQKRLKGEFTEGQILEETLTSDALTEDVYKPNGFIGITMRF